MVQNVMIYVQQVSGNWLYVKTIQDINDIYRLNEMKSVQRNFRGARVKATTEKHQLVDILAEEYN